jgi:hypothetical protein
MRAHPPKDMPMSIQTLSAPRLTIFRVVALILLTVVALGVALVATLGLPGLGVLGLVLTGLAFAAMLTIMAGN